MADRLKVLHIQSVDVFKIKENRREVVHRASGRLSVYRPILDDDIFGLILKVEGFECRLGREGAAMEVSDRMYTFTPTTVQGEHMEYFCVVLSDATPIDVVDTWKELLGAHTVLHRMADDISFDGVLVPEVDTTYTGHLARHIVKAAQWSGERLVESSNWASDQIHSRALTMKQGMKQCDQPSKVTPLLKMGVGAATMAARTAAAAMNGLVNTTATVASWGATTAARAVPSAVAHTQLPVVSDVRELAKAGLIAYTEVHQALEEATSTVLQSLREDTVQVLGHAYGDEVASTSRKGMRAVSYGLEAALAARKLGLRTTAKVFSHTAAKTLIRGGSARPLVETLQLNPPPPPRASLRTLSMSTINSNDSIRAIKSNGSMQSVGNRESDDFVVLQGQRMHMT